MAKSNYWYRVVRKDGKWRLEVEGLPDVWVESDTYEDDGLEIALVLEIARHRGKSPGGISLSKRA